MCKTPGAVAYQKGTVIAVRGSWPHPMAPAWWKRARMRAVLAHEYGHYRGLDHPTGWRGLLDVMGPRALGLTDVHGLRERAAPWIQAQHVEELR